MADIKMASASKHVRSGTVCPRNRLGGRAKSLFVFLVPNFALLGGVYEYFNDVFHGGFPECLISRSDHANKCFGVWGVDQVWWLLFHVGLYFSPNFYDAMDGELLQLFPFADC